MRLASTCLIKPHRQWIQIVFQCLMYTKFFIDEIAYGFSLEEPQVLSVGSFVHRAS